MKYEVYLVRYACIEVDAECEDEAVSKVDELLRQGYEVSSETEWELDYVE